MDVGAEILMSPRQKTLALIISTSLLILILELVRRRKLREEYSWLWLLTGIVVFVLATWQSLVIRLTELIGAKIVVSTLFFSGLMFLTAISLHFSTKVSQLSDQVKELAQRTALLTDELDRIRGSGGGEPEAS